MQPYYQDESVTIYNADCRDVLPTLDTIDLVLTDPPYNTMNKDIQLEGRSAMKRDFGEWDQEFNPTEHIQMWSDVLKVGGSALVFSSDRLISAYREGVLNPRGTIVWIKDNPAPHPRPVYVQATEWIVWLQKEGAAATWNGNGYTLNIENMPSAAGEERTEHPTQKPVKLLRRFILRHSDKTDTILDPFMGSGTTLRAAKDLNRKVIGIEIEERYCEIAAKRMPQMAMELQNA